MNSPNRGANPDFSSDELLYQLKETKASVLIVHPDALTTALAAARAADIPPDRIIVFDPTPPVQYRGNHCTVGELINQGLARPEPSYVERTLRPGEAKTKLAFLSFSSGTTGKPKVRPSVTVRLAALWKTLVAAGCSNSPLLPYNQRDSNCCPRQRQQRLLPLWGPEI